MDKSISQWGLDCLQCQQRINDYARQHFCPRLRQMEKILVFHPDEYRRYLRQHPCKGCVAQSFCDLPCDVYLQWYNARMKAARIRAMQGRFPEKEVAWKNRQNCRR